MHAETTGFARVACGVKPLHEGRSAQAAVLLHDAQNHAADNEGCRLTKAHAAAAGCQHILLQSCPVLPHVLLLQGSSAVAPTCAADCLPPSQPAN